jgi:hypothetical protein
LLGWQIDISGRFCFYYGIFLLANVLIVQQVEGTRVRRIALAFEIIAESRSQQLLALVDRQQTQFRPNRRPVQWRLWRNGDYTGRTPRGAPTTGREPITLSSSCHARSLVHRAVRIDFDLPLDYAHAAPGLDWPKGDATLGSGGHLFAHAGIHECPRLCETETAESIRLKAYR